MAGARHLLRRVLPIFAVGLAALLPPAASADLLVRRIGLLTLEAHPGDARRLDALAAEAASILPQLESDLGARFTSRFRMALIGPGGIADSAFAAVDAGAPPWAAGFVVPSLRLGAIRVAKATQYPYGTLASVLAHECAHVMLHDAGARLPLWFEEGLATWEGRRWTIEDAFLYGAALLTEDVPRLASLDTAFHAGESEAQVAYTASFAFVARAARRSGKEALRRIVHDSRTRPFADAWRDATGQTLGDAEAAWRRDSLVRYRWLPILTASSTLWVGVTFLALVAGIRKRQRARQQRQQWDQEEPEDHDLTSSWMEAAPEPPGASAPETPPDEPENAPGGTSRDAK